MILCIVIGGLFGIIRIGEDFWTKWYGEVGYSHIILNCREDRSKVENATGTVYWRELEATGWFRIVYTPCTPLLALISIGMVEIRSWELQKTLFCTWNLAAVYKHVQRAISSVATSRDTSNVVYEGSGWRAQRWWALKLCFHPTFIPPKFIASSSPSFNHHIGIFRRANHKPKLPFNSQWPFYRSCKNLVSFGPVLGDW